LCKIIRFSTAVRKTYRLATIQTTDYDRQHIVPKTRPNGRPPILVLHLQELNFATNLI